MAVFYQKSFTVLQDLKKTLELQYPGVTPQKIVTQQPVMLTGQVQLEIQTDVPGWMVFSTKTPCTVSCVYIGINVQFIPKLTRYTSVDHPNAS